jgi:hypothetical protein
MKFNSINFVYDEESGSLQRYILSYTNRKGDYSIDGQITVPASDEITLENILEVAKLELIKRIEG